MSIKHLLLYMQGTVLITLLLFCLHFTAAIPGSFVLILVNEEAGVERS